MEPARNPDITPAAAQFARPDTAERHDLKKRVLTCLHDRVPAAQQIHVAVFGSTVTVRGRLRSRDEKRLCLECCRQVSGITRIVDELIVADESPVVRDPDEDGS